MNLRQQILKRHSRANSDLIQAHVEANPEKLVELMACFFSDETVLAQRSAMAVGNLGRKNPPCLQPWWSEMIAAAACPVHPAIRRAVTRYFCELDCELPKAKEAQLIALFGKFVGNPKVNVAIAAFAMTFIANRAEQYPDAASQLQRMLVRLIPTGSPGFQNRGKKTLEQLRQSDR